MEFDLNKFNEEYEASLQEETPVDEVEEVETEEIVDEVLEDEEGDLNLDEEDEQPSESPEDTLDPNAEEISKRNSAFAQLRRERDEAKRLADWIANVAEQNGTTPEEMMQNYEQALLNKQAEEKGVPVDLLQRMKALEEENATIKNMTFAERFNSDVEKTIELYGATPDDVDKTFQYAKEQGLMDTVRQGTMSFETLHKMAHLDTITQKEVKKALQKDLSSKKKRQQEAPIPNGSSAVDVEISLEDRAKADAKRYIENGDF